MTIFCLLIRINDAKNFVFKLWHAHLLTERVRIIPLDVQTRFIGVFEGVYGLSGRGSKGVFFSLIGEIALSTAEPDGLDSDSPTLELGCSVIMVSIV